MPAGVYAGWSTRQSGYSSGAFGNHNIAKHVADAEPLVVANRQLLRSRLVGQPAITWLNQTHSTKVVPLEQADATKGQDGSYTAMKNVACCVMTADCLPVFMWTKNGKQIAAVHAGWRGLAGGILLNALAKFDHPSQVICGIGPAILQEYFEVGAEVKAAFAQFPDYSECFIATKSAAKFMADLPQLAANQLLVAGVSQVYLSHRCTYSEAKHFYSYRRDGQTGRMANLIWKV